VQFRTTGRAAAALVIALVAVAALRGSRAAGGADEYGYVSQAELWLTRNLRIDQSFVMEVPWPRADWTFTPLGYKPDPNNRRAIVPIYSPGFPMLLALVKRIAGQTAMFLVVPCMAGLLVAGTYGLGVRLGSRTAGLIGAWLVATSPVVLFMSMLTMTDVPVAALWSGAFYFLMGDGLIDAALAGLLSGAAALVRPNLAMLVGVFGLRYLLGIRGREDIVVRGELLRRHARVEADLHL